MLASVAKQCVALIIMNQSQNTIFGPNNAFRNRTEGCTSCCDQCNWTGNAEASGPGYGMVVPAVVLRHQKSQPSFRQTVSSESKEHEAGCYQRLDNASLVPKSIDGTTCTPAMETSSVPNAFLHCYPTYNTFCER